MLHLPSLRNPVPGGMSDNLSSGNIIIKYILILGNVYCRVDAVNGDSIHTVFINAVLFQVSVNADFLHLFLLCFLRPLGGAA